MISRLEHNNSSKRGRPANPIRKSSYSMRIAHAPQYTLDWFKILNVALIAKYRSKSRLAVRRTLQRCDYSNIARIGKWKKLEIVTSRINLEKLSSCPALFSHFVEAVGDALRSWNQSRMLSHQHGRKIISYERFASFGYLVLPCSDKFTITHYTLCTHACKYTFVIRHIFTYVKVNLWTLCNCTDF